MPVFTLLDVDLEETDNLDEVTDCTVQLPDGRWSVVPCLPGDLRKG